MDTFTKVFDQASETLKSYVSKLSDFQHKPEHYLEKQYAFDDFDESKIMENQMVGETDASLSLLDQMGDSFFYDQSLDSRITNLKMNSVSSRRKDQLFKRYKKEQEEKINQRRKQLELKYSYQLETIKSKGEFTLKTQTKKQIFTLKNQDLQKLKPDTDLNDTILDNYLKLLQLKILPAQVEQKTFIFSSFFMGKLCGDFIRQQPPSEKQTQQLLIKISKKVEENYGAVKRWTRKIDIFEKEFLVIPINAYKHWNCMIVVAPNTLLHDSEICRIIYLDSFFEKKNIFTEAIKTYLKLELIQKKNMESYLDSIPSYQLLVPRQTNTHDCGLYTLCFIEYLLMNHSLLEGNMEIIENRQLLKIFPRSIIFTMRECLRRLFYGLLIQEDKEKIIRDYMELRKQIFNSAIEEDYDQINEREFKKYYKINSQATEDKNRSEAEVQYLCKIKFYLDSEINHYEKDRY